MPVVSPELLAVVRAQRKQDERIAWAICPEPEAFAPSEKSLKRAKRWDAVAILGGGYTALGAGALTIRSGELRWLVIPLVLLLLVIAAYAVVWWRRVRDERTVEGTVYVLTTRRAIILHTYPAVRVQEIPIESIDDVALAMRQYDLADLAFTTKESSKPQLVFRGVTEPERARRQILKVLGDPAAADREIASSEAYLQAMHKFARSVQLGGS